MHLEGKMFYFCCCPGTCITFYWNFIGFTCWFGLISHSGAADEVMGLMYVPVGSCWKTQILHQYPGYFL